MLIDPWIETVSGIKFEFLDPKPDMISIEDIAHALSMNCRYSGHVKAFYSVAEHSVWCSYIVPPEHALAALLHDASEAYITDIASPVKQYLSNYKEMEDVIMTAISKKFGFQWPMHKAVKYADLVQLSTEAYQLMPGKGENWNMWDDIQRPAFEEGVAISCWQPALAKQEFLKRFRELFNLKGASNESLHGISGVFNSVWDYADSFDPKNSKVA